MPPIVTTSRHKSNKKTPFPLLVFLLVAAVGIGIYIYTRNGLQKPVESPVNTPNAKMGNVVGERAAEAITPASQSIDEAPDTDEVKVATDEVEALNDEVKVATNEVEALNDEAIETNAVNETSEEYQRERVFKNMSESVLAMLIMGNEGKTENPPLPNLIDTNTTPERIEAQKLKWNEDAINALTNAIVIYEDEDNLTQGQKEKIADLKEQLARIAKEGGSVADALKEFREYMNEGVGLRRQVIAETAKIEDDKEALDYVNKANEELKKEDITPVDLEEVGFVDKDSEGNL